VLTWRIFRGHARCRLIELRTVTKTYSGVGGGFTVLNHIDLKIPAGLRYGSN
jgi:hypothetical protein